VTGSLTCGPAPDNKKFEEDRHIILRVEDTGRGIASEFLPKLFDPFTQEDSFSPGAGLGMDFHAVFSFRNSDVARAAYLQVRR
jgi:phosphoglycerate-specific signal transduction histidine kinase